MKKSILLLLTLPLFYFSCSSPRPKGSTEAEILYQEAKEFISDKRYLLATERLNLIRSKYPYSYYATHAELLGADILYSQKNYTEAAAAYLVFKDFHPKYKRLSYVLYRIADSFYHQLPSTFDRDLTPGFEAIKYYKELIRTYPKSKHVKEAKNRITEASNMIQDKEQYIADFYFKTKVFDSARHRYLSILKDFAQNKRIRDHSIVRTIETSRKLGDKAACKKYYNKYKSLIKRSRLKELKRAYSRCVPTKGR